MCHAVVKKHTLLHFQPRESTALSRDPKPSFDAKQSTSSNSKVGKSSSENSNTSGACLTAQVTKEICMWATPVKVHANGKDTVVNALFDSGSGVTLCTQRRAHDLDLNGCDSKNTLSTINSTLKARSRTCVELQVWCYCSVTQVLSLDGTVTIDLPEVYSLEKLPINSDHVKNNDLQRYHICVILFCQRMAARYLY